MHPGRTSACLALQVAAMAEASIMIIAMQPGTAGYTAARNGAGVI
jgi:hypothetical protein